MTGRFDPTNLSPEERVWLIAETDKLLEEFYAAQQRGVPFDPEYRFSVSAGLLLCLMRGAVFNGAFDHRPPPGPWN